MQRSELLAKIAEQVKICQRCDLYKTATYGVPGEGNSEAKLFFIGEAPGRMEDLQGRPFVGRAGALLNLMFEKVGLKREEVFIGNMVKHRPPENRDPTFSEIAACNFWLEQQLEILDPKVVVTLGRWSLAHFLPSAKISQVHGQALRVGKRTVLPLYHPAAALRNGSIYQALQNDFIKNKQLLKNPESNHPADPFSSSGQGSLF